MANYWLDYKVISVVYCSLLRYTDIGYSTTMSGTTRVRSTSSIKLILLISVAFEHCVLRGRSRKVVQKYHGLTQSEPTPFALESECA